MLQLYSDIAKNINGVDGVLIQRVVDYSNSHGVLFHGIKNQEKLSQIQTEGLKPLSPEGGPASFWSTGLRLFFPL